MKNQLLIIGAALLACTTAAHSAPILTASLGFCGRAIVQQSVGSTPVALSGSENCDRLPALATAATAIAGLGVLGVSSSVSNNSGLGNGAAANARAEMQSAFVITGPADGPSSIPISLNLDLSGFTSTFGQFSGWFLNLNARQFGQGTVRSNLAGTGLLAAIPSEGSIIVATTITTPAVMFAVGPDHILEISLAVAANAGRVGTAQIDFSHTLSFPASGPVFNLPGGYTVNAPELGIFDNRFVSDGGSSVPEPSSMALTALALIAACLHRRKRRDCAGRG